MAAPRVMVVATDAGGGSVTAPVADFALSQGCEVRLLASDSSSKFFSDLGLCAHTIYSNILCQIQTFDPHVILVGTTCYYSAEREATSVARSLSIPTVAVLDDWSNYRSRFLDSSSQLVLPSVICCPDTMAQEEMLIEGFDEKRLLVTGHPGLAAAAEKMRGIELVAPIRPEFFPSEKLPVILLISETHSLDFGCEESRAGPLGPFLGYTEMSVRDELAALTSSYLVVEKLHPSDHRALLKPAGCISTRWVTVDKYPLEDLIYHANAIVGMKSVALFESAMSGRPTISYQPNLIGSDLCFASRKGIVRRVGDMWALRSWLREAVGNTARNVVLPDFCDSSAKVRVFEVLMREALQK